MEKDILVILMVAFGLFAIVMFILFFVYLKKYYNDKHISDDYKKELDQEEKQEVNDTPNVTPSVTPVTPVVEDVKPVVQESVTPFVPLTEEPVIKPIEITPTVITPSEKVSEPIIEKKTEPNVVNEESDMEFVPIKKN